MLLTQDELTEVCAGHYNEATEFARALERAVLEKLCEGVRMPEPDKDCEQAAFEKWLQRVCPGGDVTAVESAWKASSDYDEIVTGLCYTADQLRAYGAACRVKALEDAAAEAERMTMYPGGRQEAPAHDTVWHAARAIRALKGET